MHRAAKFLYVLNTALALCLVLVFLMFSGLTQGERMVMDALRHLDEPYVFHTKGPDRFDCSGLILYCTERQGLGALPHAAKEIYELGLPVQPHQLLPGDIVCFDTNDSDSDASDHTGIYLGNGLIIHCSGEVKKGKPTDKGWTNWAIPKGMEGGIVVWRPTVRKGSTGDDVKYVQERLIELGYDLAPYGADGKFGNKTLAAVKAFQKANGLTADGVVGPLTYEKLELAKPEPDAPLYTVSIYHLTKAQADALEKQYPDVKKEEEA